MTVFIYSDNSLWWFKLEVNGKIQTWYDIFEAQMPSIETKEHENVVIKGSTNPVEPEKNQRCQSVSKDD